MFKNWIKTIIEILSWTNWTDLQKIGRSLFQFDDYTPMAEGRPGRGGEGKLSEKDTTTNQVWHEYFPAGTRNSLRTWPAQSSPGRSCRQPEGSAAPLARPGEERGESATPTPEWEREICVSVISSLPSENWDGVTKISRTLNDLTVINCLHAQICQTRRKGGRTVTRWQVMLLSQ